MIDLIPIKEFSARYSKGWRMVPGYDLKAGDYAVTMMSPGHKLARPMKEVREEMRIKGSITFKENCRKRREAKERSLTVAGSA